MNIPAWIEAHPHLGGIARFEQLIEDALDSAEIGPTATPERAAAALGQLIAALSKADLPPNVAAMVAEVRDAGETDGHPLVRLLGCHVLRRVAPGRTVEDWNRPECPTCGAIPALAALVDDAGGRRRLLGCACCQTTWPFKRVGCPYCGDESPQAVLELEGERHFRVDACEKCRGYLKTFTGGNDLRILLADWPTLHLDAIARDRGYERRGASLYAL